MIWRCFFWGGLSVRAFRELCAALRLDQLGTAEVKEVVRYMGFQDGPIGPTHFAKEMRKLKSLPLVQPVEGGDDDGEESGSERVPRPPWRRSPPRAR